MLRIFILISLSFTISLNAKVFECRFEKNKEISMQFAIDDNNKVLRAQDGTEYINNYSHLKIKTKSYHGKFNLGRVGIYFYEPSYYKELGIKIYNTWMIFNYDNGKEIKNKYLCYDLIKMNDIRVQKGLKREPILVQDFK